MNDIILTSLRELGGLSTTFGPILVVYLAESRASLQIWKTAQLVPAPQHSASLVSSDEVKKAKRQYRKGHALQLVVLICLMGASMTGFFVAEIDKTKRDDPRFVQLYLASLSLLLLYIVATSISYMFGLYERIVFRGEDNKLFVMTERAKKSWSYRNVALVYVLSAVIVLGAIVLQSSALASLLVASIAQASTVSEVPRSFTAKGYTITALAMGLYFAYFAPMIIEGSSIYSSLTKDGLLKVDWSSLPIGSVFLSTPLQFIAVCFRFDYAECARAGDSAALSAFNTSSKKPYFLSALVGWICSVIAIGVLGALGFETSTYIVRGLCVTFVSPLFMVVAVACTAVLRGEGRRIWRYQEEWSFVGDRTEEPDILLEAGSGKAMDEGSRMLL